MRTGIFGGSFDPVHIEHIRLVEAAISALSLDRVYVLPAYVPPHKREKVLAQDVHRLAMLKEAFKNVPKAIVSDYEIARAGVSYTYLTCEHFAKRYPSDELFLLVGTDMLRDFPTWKQPETILRYATLAVCDRAEKNEEWQAEEQAKFYALYHTNFQTVGYKASAVSSTEARVLAAAGEDITRLCGENVAKYIKTHCLYKVKNACEALQKEKPSRREHSLRVALAAAKKAAELHIPERQAVAAALFHDCAKNLPPEAAELQGFTLPEGVPLPVPEQVLHQFTGAFVVRYAYGVTDENVLNAVRYHTSGRKGMSLLEQLIFLADMVEDGRTYSGVEELRSLYYSEQNSLDFTMFEALRETIYHIEAKGGEVYPLTEEAYRYFEKKIVKNNT